MKLISLFSGCGGLDSGFRDAGFESVFAIDNDPAAVAVYRRNVSEHVETGDAASVTWTRVGRACRGAEVVVGGFPCQGFSKAGPKRMHDPRNKLYLAMVAAVDACSPAVFVAENVDGLAQNYDGTVLDTIRRDMGNLGYQVSAQLLDAAAYGVPQHRRRIFIVGVRRDLMREFVWPSPSHDASIRNGEWHPRRANLSGSEVSSQLPPARTVRDGIGDLQRLMPPLNAHDFATGWPARTDAIINAIGEGQRLNNVRHGPASVRTWDIPDAFPRVTEDERDILEAVVRNRRQRRYGPRPNGNPMSVEDIGLLVDVTDVAGKLKSLVQKKYLVAVGGKFDIKGASFASGMFRRITWQEPSPTVLTNFHNPRYFLHPDEPRPLTLRETARLQGFSDDFLFLPEDAELIDGYRLVGNAVAPPVAEALATAVVAAVLGASAGAA